MPAASKVAWRIIPTAVPYCNCYTENTACSEAYKVPDAVIDQMCHVPQECATQVPSASKAKNCSLCTAVPHLPVQDMQLAQRCVTSQTLLLTSSLMCCRSMQHEYRQLARQSGGAFLQLYLKCPVHTEPRQGLQAAMMHKGRHVDFAHTAAGVCGMNVYS